MTKFQLINSDWNIEIEFDVEAHMYTYTSIYTFSTSDYNLYLNSISYVGSPDKKADVQLKEINDNIPYIIKELKENKEIELGYILKLLNKLPNKDKSFDDILNLINIEESYNTLGGDFGEQPFNELKYQVYDQKMLNKLYDLIFTKNIDGDFNFIRTSLHQEGNYLSIIFFVHESQYDDEVMHIYRFRNDEYVLTGYFEE
ncbi:hypothetical protein AAEO50_07390 [Rossellomorea oryzaecorticis]|uniref:Uncharacterized protein n=2 Tax=Rossellomorea oryzaecorticis TaxID=1396505 RepID=A0ABU9K8T3_9BACI